MVYLPDNDIWPLLPPLVDLLNDEITKANLPALARVFVAPGQDVVIADVGCEPFGWVHLRSAFPSATFPAPDYTLRGSCMSPLAGTVEVGVVRCAPAITDDRTGGVMLPTSAEESEAAKVQLADMAAIRRAILRSRAESKVLGPYTPFGPQGGVVGGFWAVTLSTV